MRNGHGDDHGQKNGFGVGMMCHFRISYISDHPNIPQKFSGIDVPLPPMLAGFFRAGCHLLPMLPLLLPMLLSMLPSAAAHAACLCCHAAALLLPLPVLPLRYFVKFFPEQRAFPGVFHRH